MFLDILGFLGGRVQLKELRGHFRAVSRTISAPWPQIPKVRKINTIKASKLKLREMGGNGPIRPPSDSQGPTWSITNKVEHVSNWGTSCFPSYSQSIRNRAYSFYHSEKWVYIYILLNGRTPETIWDP